MVLVLALATIAAVRAYRRHRAEKTRLETYDSALANLDLNAESSADAKTRQAARGCCGKRYVNCTTCGRVNASRCHQRKCARRQQRRGCCVGQRRRAKELEIAAVNAVQVPAGAVLDFEKEREHTDSKGRFSSGEKEVLADYSDNNVHVGQVPSSVDLPSYKG